MYYICNRCYLQRENAEWGGVFFTESWKPNTEKASLTRSAVFFLFFIVVKYMFTFLRSVCMVWQSPSLAWEILYKWLFFYCSGIKSPNAMTVSIILLFVIWNFWWKVLGIQNRRTRCHILVTIVWYLVIIPFLLERMVFNSEVPKQN